jgi:hypothetical protein
MVRVVSDAPPVSILPFEKDVPIAQASSLGKRRKAEKWF